MRDHFHPPGTGKRLLGRGMHGYDHSTPRAALGLTAVFMAAITTSAMVVLPAARRVHFGRLREATGAHDAALASESEFRDLFPDCEVGAMPPFGNLYGIEVYVDESLVTDDDIAFNAGTHTRVMRMPYREFERLVAPHHVHMMH